MWERKKKVQVPINAFFGLIQKHFPDILACFVRRIQVTGYFKPLLHVVVKPSPEFGFGKPLALEIILGA